MPLLDLPIELLLEITSLALDGHPCPSQLFCVNRLFSDIGQPLLYSHLEFHSIAQLTLFAEQTARPACLPKSIVVVLAGGLADFDVFRHISKALRRCRQSLPDETAPLPLELMSLCLHSHSRNPNQPYIFEALIQVNPRVFIWRGPDPEHHFSTAIVPAATHHLFCALRTWTAIAHITLTNLSFPSDALGLYGPLAFGEPLLPVLPSLRTLYLGQATLLPPSAIAAMVCLPGQDALEEVRLVDAYRQSIWGARIRRSDVERAAEALLATRGQWERQAMVERVRRVVRCEAKTERIMGGDRVEGVTNLE